jgi:hypothetical protein
MANEKPVQETQTYLEETTPHLTAVEKALELVEKDATEDAKKALKESVTAYKTVREGVSKKLTDYQAAQKAAKEAADKGLEEFKKKAAEVPKDSLVSLERVQALKKYAVENGLNEEQFNGMVKYDNDLLQGQRAYNETVVKTKLAEYETELAKDPKFSAANRAESDRKIDALYKAKASPALMELIKTVPQANHPEFKKFLLAIAEGMDAKELVAGDKSGGQEIPDYAKEFSKTAADAKAAGVRPRR